MPHIICVGACYIDTILDVPHYPNEDDKLRATTLKKRRGGNCANSLEVLTQLKESFHKHVNGRNNGRAPKPVTLSLVAVLPRLDSAATKLIRSSLPGVNLDHCIYRNECEEAASSYIIRAANSGSRTIVNHNELAEMTVDEFAKAADALSDESHTGKETDTVWWHFEGRIPETTLKCIQHLQTSHRPPHISVEVEKPYREGLETLANLADIVFYSKSWASTKAATDPSAFLQTLTRRKETLHFCTWGAEGAAGLTSNDGELNTPLRSTWRVPTSSEIVDPIGAGDTFVAGILFAYAIVSWNPVQQAVLHRALDFSVELAGRKVMQEGFWGLGDAMNEQYAGFDSC